jgi:hypothetical protein
MRLRDVLRRGAFDALIALPASLFGLEQLLVPLEDTCCRAWSILARQSSVSNGDLIWAPRKRPHIWSEVARNRATQRFRFHGPGCTPGNDRGWRGSTLTFPAGSATGLFRGRSHVRQLSCTPPRRSAGDPAPRPTPLAGLLAW